MPSVPPLALAAGLGVVAGLRALSAPALLSRRLARPPVRWRADPTRLLASERTARVLGILAVGELVGDKLPFIPARTEPLPLLGRARAGLDVGPERLALRGTRAQRT